jgi:hypothetical protein
MSTAACKTIKQFINLFTCSSASPATTAADLQRGFTIATNVGQLCIFVTMRSLRNKLPDLHHLIYSTDVDCVFIIETWLGSDVRNGLHNPEGKFSIVQKDRNFLSGGGVCVQKEFHNNRSTIGRQHHKQYRTALYWHL